MVARTTGRTSFKTLPGNIAKEKYKRIHLARANKRLPVDVNNYSSGSGMGCGIGSVPELLVSQDELSD